MKHAYLILAHNEPELLSLLVERLDDVRMISNIHFDRKLSILPDIKTQHAGLYILKDRVDVRWADVSSLRQSTSSSMRSWTLAVSTAITILSRGWIFP